MCNEARIIDAVVPVWQQQTSQDREVTIPESSLSMENEMPEEPPLPPIPTEVPVVQFMKKWWFAGVIIVLIVVIALLGRRFNIRKKAR